MSKISVRTCSGDEAVTIDVLNVAAADGPSIVDRIASIHRHP